MLDINFHLNTNNLSTVENIIDPPTYDCIHSAIKQSNCHYDRIHSTEKFEKMYLIAFTASTFDARPTFKRTGSTSDMAFSPTLLWVTSHIRTVTYNRSIIIVREQPCYLWWRLIDYNSDYDDYDYDYDERGSLVMIVIIMTIKMKKRWWWSLLWLIFWFWLLIMNNNDDYNNNC